MLESALEGQQSYVLALSQLDIALNLYKEARAKKITLTSKQQRVIDLQHAFAWVFPHSDGGSVDEMIATIFAEEDQSAQIIFTADTSNNCRSLLRVADFLITKKSAKLSPGSKEAKKAASGPVQVDDDPNASYLRLRGLPFQAAAEEISTFLGAGTTADDIFISFNHNGRPTGTCFVKVIGEENHTIAMGKNRKSLNSRYIEVFESNLKEFGIAMQRRNQLTTKRESVAKTMAIWGSEDPSYRGVVRMRGLPFQVTMDDIENLFAGIPLEREGITICTHPGNVRNNGEGFVEFASEGHAAQAVQRNRNEIQGRYIEIFSSTKGEILAHFANKQIGEAQNAREFEVACRDFASLATFGDGKASLVVRLRGLPFSTSSVALPTYTYLPTYRSA